MKNLFLFFISGFLSCFCLGCDDGPSELGDADVEYDSDTDSQSDADDDISSEYAEQLFDRIWIGSVSGEENLRQATTTFELSESSFESVTLVVDLESPCYPFDQWDEPPAGHRWPANCDAFDRNFEFTLDEPVEKDDPPAIELVRAITPFGGPMHFEIDVTDIFNGLPGQHRIQVHISTYSDADGQVSGSAGGWFVTARLDVVPGTPPRNILAVIPITNTWARFDSTFEDLPFTVPEGTTSGRIEYRVTGHGGVMTGEGVCIGPAEEFCRRIHSVEMDGTEIDTFEAWRDDCFENCTPEKYLGNYYCLENPCGDMSSVRAQRANWCPGSITPPVVYEQSSLFSPGEHTFRYFIDGIADGGSWRVSAVAIFWNE